MSAGSTLAPGGKARLEQIASPIALPISPTIPVSRRVQAPYYLRSPWTKVLDMRPGGLTPPAPKTPSSTPTPTDPPLGE